MERFIFHEPWWLDAVAPGSWAESTVEQDGRTRATLPYAFRFDRFGFVVLGAPPLSPYLGPLVDPGEGKEPTRLSRDRDLQRSLIESLPPHDIYKTTLPLGHANWTLMNELGFIGSPRVTYVLDGISDSEKVWAGFTESTRRAIRKAEKRLSVRTDGDAEALLPMARGTFTRQGLDLPYEADVLERACEAALTRDRGRVLTAVDDSGTVHASLLTVWDRDRAYYLVGGADPEHRESAGLSLLLWEALKTTSAHVDRFDFEGSMVPGVERFFRGFGGRQHTYLGVMHFSRRGRIAWALREVVSAVRR